ncbi:hypothetical protein [Streptomyces marincola]|uniref:hypothetical protein n=1 Tax=Streptomyces marincola TaxID=2878388 RepID=UPI001CF440C9|nr:hypothetical protein [Streptomyces marincola]UCM92014.1 hypothetical protein LC193_03350 [Streptomyces marincola]
MRFDTYSASRRLSGPLPGYGGDAPVATGVLVAVEIDAATVRRGDQVMIGAQAFTVRDLLALAGGAKRLVFDSGDSFVMGSRTVLWAARRVDPRRRGRA